MPNWVFNKVTITGEHDKLVEVFDRLNSPYTRDYFEFDFTAKEHKRVTNTYENPVFAFWNIIKPDTDIMEEYVALDPKTRSTTPVTDPNWWADTLANSAVSNHWYDWNVRNWGTKWEARCDTAIEDVWLDNNTLAYAFDTAWSSPDEVLIELSKQFPTVQITNVWKEEQGFGAVDVFINGEHNREDEWDIPQSHADCLEHQDECWACSYGSEEYLFADCPRVPVSVSEEK